VDFSRHKDKFPAEIAEYFHSSWETREIWRVEAPRGTIAVRDLEWHLDYPFFSSDPPLPLFDLRPRAVLDAPHRFPKHWRRVLAADLAFPVDLCSFGNRTVILDGFHRLLKCIDAGALAMECRHVSREHIRTALTS